MIKNLTNGKRRVKVSNQEILEKAIQKAIDGGFEPIGNPKEIAEECLTKLGGWQTNQLIFNHGFAKALWGYGKGIKQYDVVPDIDAWQYHLQQMVIAEDSVKYLGDNL